MNNSIEQLEKKFFEIKKMEYAKSIRNAPTSVGATFERLLGKGE